MKICQIACMSQNRVIGKDNKLPWHIPEDMKFFKEKTLGHPIIMGRKTFESLSVKPLPRRPNIIITRNTRYIHPKETFVFHNIEEAFQLCKEKKELWGDEVYICGGAEIYRQTLNVSDYIYLTIVHKDFEGDAFFPEFDLNIFKEVERKDFNSAPIPFSFITYRRT